MADVFSFSAVLEKLPDSIHTGIIIPESILKRLPPKGRVRVKGMINGQTAFSLAVQSLKDGRKYFMVGGFLRSNAKLKEGLAVKVDFECVDPNIVEIPEELEAVLAQDEEGSRIFYGLTQGAQRGLAHYVSTVKNIDSRVKRALEIVEKAKARQLQPQINADRKKKS